MFDFVRRPEPVRAGTVVDSAPVPEHVARPAYALGEPPVQDPGGPRDEATIAAMRRACALARTILERVAAAAEVGVTTEQLDHLAQELAVGAGAYPSTLGYAPGGLAYPKSLCTSVNEVACHGIPDDRALRSGDLLSIDFTAYLDGVHGDTCLTVPVGPVDRESARLMRAADESLAAGIAAVRPGETLRAVGRACQRAAVERGFTIVSCFTGHGIGTGFHAPPQVLHVDDPSLDRTVLEPGMTFTIEPILSAGDERIETWPDGWTAVTVDRSRCAQAEHTILVTEHGAEILTVADPALLG